MDRKFGESGNGIKPRQSIRWSVFESFTQTIFGTLIGFTSSYIIFPFFDIHTSSVDILGISLVFWVIGFTRNLLLRRIFNIFIPEQNRKHSLLEASSSTIIGMFTSFFGSIIIYPIFGINTSITTISELTFIFTLISITKNFLVRRFYNKRLLVN